MTITPLDLAKPTTSASKVRVTARSTVLTAPSRTDSVRFGKSDTKQPEESESLLEGFLRGFRSPLPFRHRPLAFFSPSNLKAGWEQARTSFRDEKRKSLEVVSIALALLAISVTGGLSIPFFMIVPKLAMAETFVQFFQGVHEAAAEKLAEKKSGQEEKPAPQAIEKAGE